MPSLVTFLVDEAKSQGIIITALTSIGVALASVIFYHVAYYFLDPYGLRRYPGPFLAKFSDVWLGLQARHGNKYKTVHELHKKYGTYVRIAPNNLSIADPDAIHPVYGHGNGTLKSPFYDAFVAVHRGLFNTRDRAQHTRKRKIVSHVFAKGSVNEFEPYIQATMRNFISKWDKMCEQGTDKDGWSVWFDGLNWYNYLAFDIIGDLAFGSPFGMIDRAADIASVETDDGKVIEMSAVRILNERGEFSATQGCLMPWIRPYMKKIDPWFARGQASVNQLSGIARFRVNKRLQEGAGDRKDLLSRLQAARDDKGEPLGKDELTAEALTQLIAGSDTTSNSSCAIQFWITKHPEVEKKLVKELKERLDGKLTDESPVVDYDDVKDLPYLDACINEALRRHSTSSMGLPRIIPDHVQYKGEHFLPGAVLSIPAYTLHHLDSVWGDPMVYRPERWIENGQELEKSFLPFSYGPRSCVGRNLASLELTTFMATLFYRYEFKLQDPSMDELPTVEGFLRKPTESWISIRRRKH